MDGGVGMTSDEAVEAAARGMFAEEQCDRRQKLDVESNWRGRLDDRDRDEYRRLSRAALESAAAYMLAEAWEQGFKACDGEWEQTADLVTPDEDRFVARNPYRSQA